MKNTSTCLLLNAFLLVSPAILASDADVPGGHWPRFRGPNGSGVSPDDQRAPINLTAETRLWRTRVPPGHSSPCIWGDRIFLTAFDKASGRLETLCLDRATGKILWRRPAPAMKAEKFHRWNNPAASTPATDGERVYVYFSAHGAIAYDFLGKEVWNRKLPSPRTRDGTGSSPIVHGGAVLLQRDGNIGASELLALEATTGQTRWATARPLSQQSYSTPMIWRHDDVEEVIVVGKGRLAAYDARSGEDRWWTPGMTFQTIGVAVAGEGMLFASSAGTGTHNEPTAIPSWERLLKDYDANSDGRLSKDEVPKSARLHVRKEVPRNIPGNTLSYRFLLFGFFDGDRNGIFTHRDWQGMNQFQRKNRNNVMAIRPGGRGNIADTHLAWKGKAGISEMPSSLFYRGRLYFVRDGGMLTSYDPKSGEVIIDSERIGARGQYSASPVAAGGFIYAASVRGKVVAIKATDICEVAAINDLRERITATPAILNGKVYVRTENSLHAFGDE